MIAQLLAGFAGIAVGAVLVLLIGHIIIKKDGDD